MKGWKATGRKGVALSAAALLFAGSAIPQGLVPRASAAIPDHLVISQVFGGGGNTNALVKNDYIELYNPTDADVDLTDWSVQYYTAGTTASGINPGSNVTTLSGTIKSHGFYLITEGAGTNGTAVTGDASGSISMAAGAGKIALVSNSTPVDLTAPGSTTNFIDFVGYSSSSAAASHSETAPILFKGDGKTGIMRKSTANGVGAGQGNGWDTDNNSDNFVSYQVVLSSPRSTQSPLEAPTASNASVKPLAAKILLDNRVTTAPKLTGEAGSVANDATVNAYDADPAAGGSLLGTATAGADGAFDLTLTSASAGTIFVTSTETGKDASPAQEVRAASAAAAITSAKVSFTVDASGIGTVAGAGGAALANAKVSVYNADPATGGTKLAQTAGGANFATADASGAFSFRFDSVGAVDKVFVVQEATTDSGKTFESAAAEVAKTDPSTTVSPISALRQNDANGASTLPETQTYIIEGTMIVDNKVLDAAGNNSFYIQDATGGIYIYSATSVPADIKSGDKVRATGKVKPSNGLTQLIEASVEKIGTAAPNELPQAVSKTFAQATKYDTAEALEGSLVTVNATVKTIPTALTGGGYNVTVTDENDSSKTMFLRVMGGTGIDPATTLEVGKTYTFTGILSQFDTTSPFETGYQLFPRTAADFVPVEKLNVNHTAVTQAYSGQNVTFTADVDGTSPATVSLYYREAGSTGSFAKQAMTADATNPKSYGVSLPTSTLGATGFEYYIEAVMGGLTRTSGTANVPYHVNVIDDVDGPAFSGELPKNGTKSEGARPDIEVKVSDPSGVTGDSFQVQVDGADVAAGDWTYNATSGTLKIALKSDLALGEHMVKVTASDLLGNAKPFTWSFETVAAFIGGNHYRGTTHNHTNISHDGAGAPKDALEAAKAHHYDWFAFSDHSHDIDPGQGTEVDDPANLGFKERTGGDEWKLTHDLATEYTNDKFVVFPAFEMTSTTWGHSNVFGTTNFVDRLQNGGKYQDLNQYYNWVLTHPEAVAQFNHPDMSDNAFNGFQPYSTAVDALFQMLEVGNGSGHYGYENAEGKFYHALDLGWHVAPTFGEDNHDATWGQTDRRTVIVAPSLKQDDLMNSMRNLRVYMEEDPNFQLDVLANGQYMGATVNSNSLTFDIHGKDDVKEYPSMPGYEYMAKYDMHSDDRIAKVELLTNGGKVVDTYKPENPADTGFNWQPTVNADGGQQWFVVKVTQQDGEQVYSSPIWSKETPQDVRVNGVHVTGDAIIGDTPADLEAGISNMGTEAITNLNVKFYVDKVDDKNLIGSTTVASLAAKSVATAKVHWDAPPSGTHTILAVIDNAPDGDATTDNTASKELLIKDPLHITVLIDAKHGNENSSSDPGKYANNLTAVSKLLQTEGYTMKENKQPLAADILSGAQVLVLTHPASDLTADENAAVAEWVKNGGSLLLADKSNFSNNPTVNNDLLQAIGSTIQINNDGVFDKSKSGNFWADPIKSPYSVRLHPGLIPNRITDRVLGIDYYSGSSLMKNGNLPLTDSDTVTILAHGNETTYQESVKTGFVTYDAVSDETGGSQIPLIASEQVDKGRVIVSGMNIFNDKQLDETYEAKGNNEFALNAVNWLAHHEPVVKSIADVRGLEDGTPVVVEGTVTSGAGTFFDAFNIQDATGGIMAFNEVPPGTELALGDKVRVYGKIKTFENNKELEFGQYALDVIKLGHDAAVEPKAVTTADAVKAANKGQLVKVTGTVKSKYDANSYVINDGSGDVLVFTDGYIADQSGAVPILAIGDTLEAVGIVGDFTEGTRIRVRDTKELKKLDTPPTDPGNGDGNGGSTDPGNGNGGGSNDPSNGNGGGTTPGNNGGTQADDHGLFKLAPQNGGAVKAVADTAKLNELIDSVFAGGQGQRVTLTVDTDAAQVQTELPAASLEKLAGKGTAAVLEVQTRTASFALPAVSLQKVLQEQGMNPLTATVRITLNQADADTASNVSDVLKKAGATSVDTPQDFRVEAVAADGRTVQINTFSDYAEHMILLSADMQNTPADQLAGVWFDVSNNTFRPVPMLVVDKDGKRYAVLKRMGNSWYTVVQRSMTFADVPTAHYAKENIEALASKFIINGDGAGSYSPNRNVTRAEFAALLVRALGLETSGQNTAFTDVSSDAWYASAVKTAYDHQLLGGYGDGTFRPGQSITRQEMARMILNATKASGRNETLGDVQEQSLLYKYQDRHDLLMWGREPAALLTKWGIMNGVSEDQFSPNTNADRGQAAAILFRMMQKLQLID
jgi:large repetitive protein